jgi:ankyrin repeat protein
MRSTAVILFIAIFAAMVNSEIYAQALDQELLEAAEKGNLKTVTDLLESSASPNVKRQNEGSSALMLACAKGHTEVAKALIDKGADVNAANQNGWTALMGAASYGHLDIVKLLVERGADVNARHAYGYTGLKLAKGKNHKQIAEFLVKSGAIR